MMRRDQFIAYAEFFMLVADSVEYRRRKEWYDQEVSELTDDEFLVAYCERYGEEPIYVDVESFVDFCELLEAVQDYENPIFDVELYRADKRLRSAI